MIEIAFSSSFKRAFKKRISGNRRREEHFWQAVKDFRENPHEPSLRTHKLSGKLKELWSFSLEYDLRILFYFQDADKVVFIDIGSHKEVY